MSWIILAIINVLATAVANLYQKIAMREEKNDAISSAIAFQLLTGLCYLTFALIQGFQLPPISLAPYFLGTMTFYAAGTVCFFRAIKLIEVSEMSIISGVGAIVTIITSMIFLHDFLSGTQLIGATFILMAVVVINLKKKGFVINQGMWYALAGTSLYGSAVIFDTAIIRVFDAVSFIPIGSFGTALVMMMAYPKKFPQVVKQIKRIDKNLLIYSVLYATSAITFYLALETGAKVGQISTVVRSAIIVTVLLSSILLKERDNMDKKIIGAILTTVGVILVSS